MKISNMAKSMADCLHKSVEVICKDGEILRGRCSYYTSPIDNDSGLADITVQTKNEEYIAIRENEIARIKIV